MTRAPGAPGVRRAPAGGAGRKWRVCAEGNNVRSRGAAFGRSLTRGGTNSFTV